MKTLYSQLLPIKGLAPAAAITTATTSATVDTGVFSNNFRDVVFAYLSGTVTDGTWAVTLQECDTSGGSYTAVDASRIQGALPSYAATDDNVLKFVGCRPTKRYVQAVITPTGATTGGVFACVALLGNGGNNPPAQA